MKQMYVMGFFSVSLKPHFLFTPNAADAVI